MKILITIILTACTLTVFSQQINRLDFPSNSFENEYRKTNPALTYSYDSAVQTHNYSNNWDFDRDGIKDELYFVGTHGAHLYFNLKVILSADKISREFNFIQTDIPYLTAADTIDIEKTVFGFIVADIGENNSPTIIVRLDDQTYYANKKILTKKKITTKRILISFDNGKPKYGSL